MKGKFRFTIARRIALGFSILMLAVFFTSYQTYNTLNKNLKDNQLIINQHYPSASALKDMQHLIVNSKLLIKNWVHEEELNSEDKNNLQKLHSEGFPKIQKELSDLIPNWSENDKDNYLKLCSSIDSLFYMHREIMTKLSNLDTYKNANVMFEIMFKIESGGEIIELSEKILRKLEKLNYRQKAKVRLSNRKMEKSFSRFKRLIIFMGIILFFGVFSIAIIITTSISSPIKYIQKIIKKMSKGILPDKEIKSRSDEIGEMANALNELVNGLQKTSEFAQEIGKRNYNSGFKPLSNQDVLGNSLIDMRKELMKAVDEEEKRKEEDFQRNWTSQGLAKFSEILRKNSDNINDLSFVIIKNLVRYLNASQGGMFIINDSNSKDIYIDLVAAFAYNRKKTINKKINLGEGLVGRCVQENETIYMTDVPKDYIRITSGMGDDTPRCLLLVPLKINEEIFGVVEIASFALLTKYQIAFVEKIGESIASTIQSVKININTAKLLSESQDKSQKLASQEEVMRKNIELIQKKQKQNEEEMQLEIEKMKNQYQITINDLKNNFKKDIEKKTKEIEHLKNYIKNITIDI